MKYNVIATAMIMAFIVSRNPTPPPPSPEEEWNSYVKINELLGYKILSVAETQQWIEKHQSEITIPAELSYAEEHLVMETPFLQQYTINQWC